MAQFIVGKGGMEYNDENYYTTDGISEGFEIVNSEAEAKKRCQELTYEAIRNGEFAEIFEYEEDLPEDWPNASDEDIRVAIHRYEEWCGRLELFQYIPFNG
jgi:hypothetical protein